MISKMSRVEIAGPMTQYDRVLYTIQDEGVLHLETIPLSDSPEKGALHRAPLSDEAEAERVALEGLSEILADAVSHIPDGVRSGAETSDRYEVRYAKWENEDVAAISVAGKSMHAKVRSFLRRRRNLDDDLQVLASYEDIAAALAPLVESNEFPQHYEFTGVIFDSRSRNARNLLRDELAKITAGDFRYFETPVSDGRMVALIGYSPQFSHDARSFMLEAGIGQLNLPRYMRDKPFEQALAELEEDLEQLRSRKDRLERQIESFYAESAADLVALFHVVHDRYERYEASSMVAVTRYTFFVRGWVPRRSIPSLTRSLDEISGGSVVVRRLAKPRNESPPVVIRNPNPVRQFEPLLKLFPLPKYGTIDPTSYLAAVFPPMFGLMLADVGYGIFVAAGALLVKILGRGKQLWNRIAVMVASCAFFTIGFGFVYGEFFGQLGKHWFHLHPLWQERFTFTGPERAHLLLSYMAVSLVIGFVHVLLGLVLGIINHIRTKNRTVVYENIAKIFGIFAILFLVGRLAQYLPPVFTSVGIAAAVGFLAFMIVQIVHDPAHGYLLPLELIGSVGNVLSYVRIMAIGLVSVVLAYLANSAGVSGNIILGLILALLIHALNLGLGIIDPTIQGLRLNYVEFFRNFFVTGGTPYTPLKKIGGVNA